MKTNLDELMRKTRTYWYEDGLAETLAGLFFITLSAWLLVDWSTANDAPHKWLFSPGLVVLVFAWVFSARRIIDWFKQRITYPRTGFVAYRLPPRRARLPLAVMAGVIGGAVAIAITVSLMYRQDIGRVIPIVLGGGVAVLFVYLGSDLGLPRFYVQAACSLLAGLFLAWLTADMGLAIGLYYGLLGVAVTVAGIVTLARYLRAAPVEGGGA